MRLTTRNTRAKRALIITAAIALSLAGMYFVSKNANALDDSLLDKYSANNIMFYDPDDNCSSGYMSKICGNTAKEKYWSAIRMHFDVEPTAGILGNIWNEGGFSPIGVESCTYLYPYDFSTNSWTNGWESWDYFLHNRYSKTGRPTGIGGFGITYFRSEYLLDIQENYPELLKYHQYPDQYAPIHWYPGRSCVRRHPEFDTPGDDVLDQIGEADFNASVEIEVNEMIKEFTGNVGESGIESFKKMGVREAAAYFAKNYERCSTCQEAATQNARADSAEHVLEEMKDFKCSGSVSTSTTPVSTDAKTATQTVASSDDNKQITLIGDSISVQSEAKLKEKFPTSFLNKVGSRHSTSKGMCDADGGGLDALAKISSGSGTVANQKQDGSCESQTIDASAFKNNVVWELGTNSVGATKDTLEKVLEKVGNRNLFLVTPYDGLHMTSADNIADMYRSFAEEHENVYIVEWNKSVRDDESKYITRSDSMAVHPTEDGRQLLADLIYEAIMNHGGCTTYDGEYPEYLQWKGDWAEKDYGSVSGYSRTYHTAGCGPSSYAMIATVVTGQDIFPDDVGELTIPTGYYWNTSGSGMTALDKIVGDKYGYEVIDVPYSTQEDAIEKIRQYLNDGYLLHMSGAGSAPFTSGGHYVGVFAIEGDTLKVADPNLGNKDYDIEAFVKAGLHGGSFSASKGSGGGSCNPDTCKADNNVGDGLTEEQAQKLADYYNGDQVDENVYGLPYGKMNCVSFSAFFVQHFTDVGVGGATAAWGNGDQFVDNLKTNYDFEVNDKFDNVQPFTIFSTTIDGTHIHTGVIVGKDGDNYITVEAAYQKFDAKVFKQPASYFTNLNSSGNKQMNYILAYATSKNFKKDEMKKIVGDF